MIHGLDVWSAYRAGSAFVDMERVRDEAGIRFIIARHDKACRGYLDDARAAGLVVGVYHVFHWQTDPQSAVKAVYATSDGVGSRVGELPLALDVELPQDPRPVAKQLVERLERTIEAVEERYGRSPMIYTYPWYWARLGSHGRDSEVVRRCPLWLAQYSVGPRLPRDGEWPKGASPWGPPDVWQFSGDASAPVAGTRTWKSRGAIEGSQAIDRCVVRSRAALDALTLRTGLRPLDELPPKPSQLAHLAAAARAAWRGREK